MMQRRLRLLAWLATAFAVGGVVATCAAPIAWRSAEQRRWKQSALRLQDLVYVVETYTGTHNRLPDASTATELLALGIPPMRILDTKPERSANDGWGRPILYRYAHSMVDGQERGAFVVISAGADGQYEPETRALLGTRSDRYDLFEGRGRALTSEAMKHAGEAQNLPLYQQAKADLVAGTYAHNIGLREGTSVPPDVRRRALLQYGIPSLVFALVALVLFRASRPRPATEVTSRG
jgi:hypothetical protein